MVSGIEMHASIRSANEADLAAVATMRAALWPDDESGQHRDAAAAMLGRDDVVLLVAVAKSGEAAGFAEASIRRDYVNGCDTSPVAFVEGLYVMPDRRRAGIAAALVARIAEWGRAAGCVELASDAALDDGASHRFHRAIGFEETERVVFFRKPL